MTSTIKIHIYTEVASENEAREICDLFLQALTAHGKAEVKDIEKYWKIPEYFGIWIELNTSRKAENLCRQIAQSLGKGWVATGNSMIWNHSDKHTLQDPRVRWVNLEEMTSSATEDLQKNVCNKYGAKFHASPSNLKVGISLNVREGIIPINGFRHPAELDTTGWYIYSGEGEIPKDEDFFKPLHIEHLAQWCPQIIMYLGLPPGWRFIVASDYEDVWFDESLLDI